MLPASSSGDGFYALNAFHLRAGQQPPQLFPDAVYTYGALESLRQVDDDVRQNLCTPSQVRVFAIWTEPLPAVAVRDRGGTDEGGDHHDDNGGAHNDRGDPPADAAEESETVGDSAETDMGHGSVVPHPDRASVESAIPRVQVPAPQRMNSMKGYHRCWPVPRRCICWQASQPTRPWRPHEQRHGALSVIWLRLSCNERRGKSSSSTHPRAKASQEHLRVGTDAIIDNFKPLFLAPAASAEFIFYPRCKASPNLKGCQSSETGL